MFFSFLILSSLTFWFFVCVCPGSWGWRRAGWSQELHQRRPPDGPVWLERQVFRSACHEGIVTVSLLSSTHHSCLPSSFSPLTLPWHCESDDWPLYVCILCLFVLFNSKSEGRSQLCVSWASALMKCSKHIENERIHTSLLIIKK